MAALDPTLLILLALAALGILSHNMTVTLAILILIAIRITPLNSFFPVGGKIRVNHRCLDFNYRRNGTNCQWQNQRQRGIALICSVEIYLSHCRGGWRYRGSAGEVSH